MKIPRQHIWFSRMKPSKIGSDLANANFNANASANSNVNAIWSDFCFRFAKICSPLELEAHFENQLWAIGLQHFTFWSIEGFKWALIGQSFWHLWLLNFFVRRFSASVAHPNFEKSSAKHVVFAQGAVLQNDIIYHTCNFVTFWWLVPFAVCFWWLHIHFFAKMLSQFAMFSYFYKNMLPAGAGHTFLKPNSEQSAFKNAFFVALKALDQDWMCHLFGTYRSFGRSVRLSSASIAHQNFDSRLWLVQF